MLNSIFKFPCYDTPNYLSLLFYRMPAPDQKPMCLKRAEDVFLANSVKGAQVLNYIRL